MSEERIKSFISKCYRNCVVFLQNLKVFVRNLKKIKSKMSLVKIKKIKAIKTENGF